MFLRYSSTTSFRNAVSTDGVVGLSQLGFVRSIKKAVTSAASRSDRRRCGILVSAQ